MNKKDLAEKVSLTPATIAKMGKGEFVSMEILYRSRKKIEYRFCGYGFNC